MIDGSHPGIGGGLNPFSLYDSPVSLLSSHPIFIISNISQHFLSIQ